MLPYQTQQLGLAEERSLRRLRVSMGVTSHEKEHDSQNMLPVVSNHNADAIVERSDTLMAGEYGIGIG